MEQALKDAVAEYACWASGSDRPWEHDAIVGADFLKALCELAAKAPKADIQKFIKWVSA